MSQTDLFPTATLSFTDFWQIFPRKTAKQISEKAWYKLSIPDQASAFKDCVKRYKSTPKQFIPHASTYLNQARWQDEIIEIDIKKSFADQATDSRRANGQAWLDDSEESNYINSTCERL